LEKITEADIRSYPLDKPKIAEWLKTKSGKTPKLYTWALIKFDRLSPVKITELLEQTDNGSKSLLDRRTLITKVIEPLSNGRRIQVNSAIRSLLDDYGLKIARNNGRVKRISTQYYDAYTPEQAADVIDFLDKPEEKLFAIICRESGLRGDKGVLDLRWKHVQKDYSYTVGPIWLELDPEFRNNNKHSGFTFIGDRARTLIGKLVEDKKIRTEPESPLFTFTYNSLIKTIGRAKRKAHVGANVHTIHGFRSLFENSLISAKVPDRIIDILFGRFKTQDAKAYTTRKRDELLPYYEQAYPYLDYKNNAPAQSQQLSTKLTELQDQNRQLNERLQLTEAKLSHIREIQSEPGAKTINAWAQQPNDQVMNDLSQLFRSIVAAIERAREINNFELPPLHENPKSNRPSQTTS